MKKLFLSLALCLSASAEEDLKLKKLKAKARASETQMAMNINTHKIALHLDKKLIALEDAILKTLDEKAQKLFKQMCQDWRSFRKSQINFKADMYRGGSIQPQIRNSTFSELTELRLEQLKTILDY